MDLSTSRRMADSQNEQKVPLEKIRHVAMDLTEEENGKLKSLHLKNFTHEEQEQIKEKAVFLYYTNKKKDSKNMEMLEKLTSPSNPVAIIRPATQGPRAVKSISSHFNNKKPLNSSLLAIGARVAIENINHKPSWGLYNGACGIVDEIVFTKSGANPNTGDMPDYVVVDFPSYTGPPWDMANPTHIPISPAKLMCNRRCCQREMIPLILAGVGHNNSSLSRTVCGSRRQWENSKPLPVHCL